MAKHEYKIVNDFQVKQFRVLELDSDYEDWGQADKALIDGEYYDYNLNSIRTWIVIESNKSFKGKSVTFVKNIGEISEAIAS